MSARDTSRGGRDPNDQLDDGTDWDRILAMTDEEAYRNAIADEDSQPLTPQQLARMRRAPNPRAIRQRLGMTQKEFARQFQISVDTLRDWEQGLHFPDSTATAFLRVIEREPEAVLRALHPSAAEPESSARDSDEGLALGGDRRAPDDQVSPERRTA